MKTIVSYCPDVLHGTIFPVRQEHAESVKTNFPQGARLTKTQRYGKQLDKTETNIKFICLRSCNTVC